MQFCGWLPTFYRSILFPFSRMKYVRFRNGLGYKGILHGKLAPEPWKGNKGRSLVQPNGKKGTKIIIQGAHSSSEVENEQ